MIIARGRNYFAVLAVFFPLLLVNLAYGQTPGTGAISGIVFDPSNRVVVNAEVSAVSADTHISRSVTTTSTGLFRIPLLPPGSYVVTVRAAGFAVNTSQLVVVTVSQASSLNVTLAVAGENKSLQVSGQAQVADLESSTLGGLVNNLAIEALPLSNRNFMQILGLAPGVVTDLPTPSSLGRGTINVSANGATPTSNNIQFNGIDANNMAENSASNAETSIVGVAVPAPDTIQEFRVQTANFDAAYGRSTGGNVDLVTKTGKYRFLGIGFDIVRN
jgi:hypothetical protein